MSKQFKNNLITYGIIIVFFAIMQTLASTGNLSSLFKGLLVPICVYAIMAVSLNLTVGILGELSLGHAGFMCVGAFASAFFSMCLKDSGMNSVFRFILAILIAAAVAAIFGVLIGIPVLRLRGDYLAIVTLAFGEIIKNLVNVMYIGRDSKGFHISLKDTAALGLETDGQVIIKGPQGITGTPNDSSFIAGTIILLIAVFIITNFVNSRSGRAVMSIRDNRIASESIGINISKYKIMAFALSASIAGAAGALYAHNLNTLNALPKNFGYNMSIMILVYVVLGGIGSIRGSIIAATILTALPELLRGFSDYRMIIYSVVLIALMLISNNPKAKTFLEQHDLRTILRRAEKEDK